MSEERLDPRVRAALQALEEVPPRSPRRAARGKAAFLAEVARIKAEHEAATRKKRGFGFLPVSIPLLPRLKGHTTKSLWQEVQAMPTIAIIILALAVFTGGTAATVYAADQAVPGEPLYAVDVAVEQLQLTLATDPATEAELHLRFAQERLAEIQVLAQQGNTEAVAQAAQNLEQHLMAAQQAIQQAGQPDMVQQMQQVAQQAQNTLQDLPVTVPVDVPVVAATPAPSASPAPSVTPDPSATPMPGMGTPTPEPATGKVEFVGTVESMDGDTWTVDGQAVVVTFAEIKDAIQVGDLVKVEAYLQADGTLRADEIKLAEGSDDATPSPTEEPYYGKVEFSGTVESMDGDIWVVAGQTLIVTGAEIKDAIQVGDFVKVEAYIQADGSLLAKEIERSDDGDATPSPTEEPYYGKMEFTGTVESMDGDTWVVNGQTIIVTGAKIKGDIQVGDTVKVEAYIQADGSLLADEIELTSGDDSHDASSDDSSSDDASDDDSSYQDDDHDDDDSPDGSNDNSPNDNSPGGDHDDDDDDDED